MKTLFRLLFAVAFGALLQAQTVPQNVQKASGTNEITAPLVIGSGKTLSATGTGTISATSVTGLSVASGKTLTASNTLTLTGTDGASIDFGGGGTVLYSGGPGFVSSISGTLDQIAASASTGDVTLSLSGPHAFTSLSSNAVLLGAGSSPISASNLSYSAPTLSTPDGFTVSSAGSLTFSAGGLNKDIIFNASGTGDFYYNSTDTAYLILSSSNASKASAFRFRNTGGSAPFPDWEIGVGGSLGSSDEAASVYFYDNYAANYRLILGARTKPSWSTRGAQFALPAGLFTDSTSSGTIATAVSASFGIPTFTASASTTYTNAANVYIAGDVAAGTNVTLTNSYGLWNVGKTRVDGGIYFGGTTPGSISGSSGAVSVASAGTNQNITLTPSGTGKVVAGKAVTLSADTAGFTVDASLSNYASTNGVYLNGNSAGWLNLAGDGTRATSIRLHGATAVSDANVIYFLTNSSERARFTSGGNLLVGSTTDYFTGSGSIASSNQIFTTKSAQAATVSTALTDYPIRLKGADANTYAAGIGFSESVTASGNVQAAISSVDMGASGALGLAFSTGNNTAIAERLRITDTGVVSVLGTTASTSTSTGSLTVGGGAGVAGALYAQTGVFTGTNSASSYPLTVKNNAAKATTGNYVGLLLQTSDASPVDTGLVYFGNATAASRYWRLGAYDNGGTGWQPGTLMGQITVSDGYRDLSSGLSNFYVSSTDSYAIDKGGSMQFLGSYTGTTQTSFGGIKGAKENATDANTAGYLAFSTRPAGGAMTERMRVSSTGNVTIAGATANGRLAVLGAANSNAGYFKGDATTGQSYGIGIEAGTNSTDYALKVASQGGGVEYFKVRGDGIVSASNTTEATTGGAGSLTTAGGIYVAKKVVAMGGLLVDKTVTAGGTTGAQTINKPAGTVNFAAAATSLVVTNSLVTTSSIIICTVGTNDATMQSVQAVAGSGSFTLYPNAAPTAETRVNFFIVN